MSATLFLFLVLNFGISWFNAWSVGRSWNETRAVGGVAHFMAWCGAVMSASGFTWCYLVLLTLINSVLPVDYRLPEKYAEGMFHLGYLIIIFPILGSGLAITVQSWAHFWRNRNFKNGALAGWNTFAQVYNTYQSIKTVPQSLSFVSDLFKSDGKRRGKDDARGQLIMLMVVLVVLAVMGGVLTTALVIRSTARSVAREQAYRARTAKLDNCETTPA
jgi:hypothetical protein